MPPMTSRAYFKGTSTTSFRTSSGSEDGDHDVLPPCVFRTIEEGHRGVREILVMTLEMQLLGPVPDLQSRGQDEITWLPGLHEACPFEATRNHLSYLLTLDLIRLQADSLFKGLEKGVFGSVVTPSEEAVVGLGLDAPGPHLFGQAMAWGEDEETSLAEELNRSRGFAAAPRRRLGSSSGASTAGRRGAARCWERGPFCVCYTIRLGEVGCMFHGHVELLVLITPLG